MLHQEEHSLQKCFKFVSVCFETGLFVSAVSKRVRNNETNRNKPKKIFFPETNRKKWNRLSLRICSLQTENISCLCLGNPTCRSFQLWKLSVRRSDEIQQDEDVNPLVMVAAHSPVRVTLKKKPGKNNTKSKTTLGIDFVIYLFLPFGSEAAGPVDRVCGGPLHKGLLSVEEDKLEAHIWGL